MKKIVLVIGLVLIFTASITAQDYDNKVKAAINGLSSRLTSPLEISVDAIYYEGTESTSGLSRSLANKISQYAAGTGRFIVSALTRGGSKDGVIRGTYRQGDENVYITLQLIRGGILADAREIVVSIAELKQLGLEILPENMKTVEAIKQQETIFLPPAPAPQTNNTQALQTSALKIEAWPDSATNTYFIGDKMRINLLANKDCYVRVDYTDAEGKMQLIFPNHYNRDNFLRANQVQTIPQPPVEIVMEPPLGMERVWVRVSTVQFVNIESEFAVIKNATRETVNASRGAGLQYNPQGITAETAETYFSITTLNTNYYDETYSYVRPDSMTTTIQEMRASINQQGGILTGNEQSGTFSYPGVQGSYSVQGNSFIVNIRYTGSRLPMPLTRGSAYRFSIDKPKDMAQAIQSVRSGIESNGGTFEGNEQQGSFRASGITGQYNVEDRVNISITEKPFIVPNSLIEKEVKSYFLGK